MSQADKEKLDRQIDRIAAALPGRAGRFVHWLREPSSRWVRIPVGVLLILCGIVGFLPVLGFWMVPLGALLLAQDIPFLQGPIARALEWAERKWSAWKERRSGG